MVQYRINCNTTSNYKLQACQCRLTAAPDFDLQLFQALLLRLMVLATSTNMCRLSHTQSCRFRFPYRPLEF